MYTSSKKIALTTFLRMRHKLLPPLVRAAPTCHHGLGPRLLNGVLSLVPAQFHTSHCTSNDTPGHHLQDVKKAMDLTDEAESMVQDHTDDDDESVQSDSYDDIGITSGNGLSQPTNARIQASKTFR